MKMRAQFLLLAIWTSIHSLCHCSEYPYELRKAYRIAMETETHKPCSEEPRCTCQAVVMITKSVTIVNCRNSSLTDIPKLPNNTYILDLSQNQIDTLGKNKFISYSILNMLNISHNKLKEILPGAFEGLQELKYLSLQGNHIRYNSAGFHPRAFKPLVNLKHLNIQQTFILHDFTGEDYKLEALSDLANLTFLGIDGINEKNLSDALMYLPYLTEIYFSTGWSNSSRCYLPTLHKTFFPPNTLISNVSLSDCEIRTIEPTTFKPLSNLAFLDLSHNEKLTLDSLKNISDGLQFTKIAVLKLNKVYETLGSCVEITKEHLDGLRYTNLTEIYLESNRISHVQNGAITHSPETLKVISLRDNILLLNWYVLEVQYFKNLQKIIISDQNRNHYWRLRKKRNDKEKTVSQSFDDQPLIRKLETEQVLRHYGTPYRDQAQPHFGQHIDFTRDIIGTKSDITKRHTDKSEFDSAQKHQVKRWNVSLPEKLQVIDASNMKTRLTLESKYLEPNNLKELYLSRNIFWAWHGPFKGFENLTKLDLSWNYCTEMHLNVFEGMPGLKYLNLSLNLLDMTLNMDANGTIFRHQGKLEILSLSENKIRDLPRNIFSGLKKLKALFLARNLLKDFKVDLSHMNQLKRINLYDNQLETISKEVRNILDRQALATNLTLNIERNNFRCDCVNIEFVKWIAESPVRFENKENYVCHLSDRTQGNLTNAKEIYQRLGKDCYNYTPTIIASTAALVLVLSLSATAVIYRYRWNLRYMYYMAKYKARVPTRRGYEPIGLWGGGEKGCQCLLCRRRLWFYSP